MQLSLSATLFFNTSTRWGLFFSLQIYKYYLKQTTLNLLF